MRDTVCFAVTRFIRACSSLGCALIRFEDDFTRLHGIINITYVQTMRMPGCKNMCAILLTKSNLVRIASSSFTKSKGAEMLPALVALDAVRAFVMTVYRQLRPINVLLSHFNREPIERSIER